jgi:hypothetical protein
MKLASCVIVRTGAERAPHALRVSSIDVIAGEPQIHVAKSPHPRRLCKECAKLRARHEHAPTVDRVIGRLTAVVI